MGGKTSHQNPSSHTEPPQVFFFFRCVNRGFLVVSFSSGGHDAIWLTKRLGSSNLLQLQLLTSYSMWCALTAHLFLFWGCFLPKKNPPYITCFFGEYQQKDIHQQRKPKRAQVFRGHGQGYQPPPGVSWVEIVQHKLGMGHLHPWRIHGTGMVTYMKTIKIHHSCR